MEYPIIDAFSSAYLRNHWTGLGAFGGVNLSDFVYRLSLPIMKCYPLVNALIRAGSGTQTSDDTEILRHYLTPLGIGGI